MCVCGRMGEICMCVREMGNVCVWVYGCNCVCAFVCVLCAWVCCVRTYLCVHVCVCVCVWESERARESERAPASKRACLCTFCLYNSIETCEACVGVSCLWPWAREQAWVGIHLVCTKTVHYWIHNVHKTVQYWIHNDHISIVYITLLHNIQVVCTNIVVHMPWVTLDSDVCAQIIIMHWGSFFVCYCVCEFVFLHVWVYRLDTQDCIVLRPCTWISMQKRLNAHNQNYQSIFLSLGCMPQTTHANIRSPQRGVVCVRSIPWCVCASRGVRLSYIMAHVALGRNKLWGVLYQRARAFQKSKSFYSASTPLASLKIQAESQNFFLI